MKSRIGIDENLHMESDNNQIDIDLYLQINYEGAIDEPLPYLLFDTRAVRSTVVDRLWVRLVDADRALATRRTQYRPTWSSRSRIPSVRGTAGTTDCKLMATPSRASAR